MTQTSSTSTQELTQKLSDDARRVLATNAHDADDLKRLGLVLGLFEETGENAVITASPWAEDGEMTGDPRHNSPHL